MPARESKGICDPCDMGSGFDESAACFTSRNPSRCLFGSHRARPQHCARKGSQLQLRRQCQARVGHPALWLNEAQGREVTGAFLVSSRPGKKFASGEQQGSGVERERTWSLCWNFGEVEKR